MEYKKGEKGFIVEFNEAEETNLERFIDTIKNHDEFNGLSSKSEFLALILNEGVAAIQLKTNTLTENQNGIESLSSSDFLEDLLVTLLNETMSSLQSNRLNEENSSPSLGELLTILPDINSLYDKMDPLGNNDKSLTLSPNSDTEVSPKNTTTQ
ncbi:hypothetical protein BABA_18402 [Neobacillus bataviensis LMG 21833]|uniref:Uncharacterized protein n=1 Tax=Neobacillus bataviensis LMG 21833 TaxID=1117379 RepID=K6DY15_9BACI|nr:hypothetical protein [Neobacillus bataviensis]EKN65761.1 hypothetical protein BABA_18402 [Neobacillus bataviensis LMG 21833]